MTLDHRFASFLCLASMLLVGCGSSDGGGGGDDDDDDDVVAAPDMEVTATVDLSAHGVLWSLAADTNHCYVGTDNGELLVFDVSDAAAPSQVGSYTHSSGSALNGLTKDGDLIYATYETAGLVIIDVADPASPSEQGADEAPDYTGWEPLKDGDLVYWVGGGQNGAHLHVTDVSDPTAPQHISTFTILEQTLGANAIAKSGDIVYTGDARGDLYAVDVSDPANPAAAGSLLFTYARGVDDAEIQGNTLYFAKRLDGLFIIDVSDSANPAELATFALEDGWAADGQLDGNTLVLAYGDAGLVRVDVSDPAAPVQLGDALVPTGGPNFERLALIGNHACVADTGLGSSHRLYVVRVNQ